MKTNNRLVTLALGSAVILMLALAAVAGEWLATGAAFPAKAQNATDTSKPNQITVRGSGSISAKPDILTLDIGAVVAKPTVKEAQTGATSIINAMQAKIKAAGIEDKDYRTVQYSVDPIQDFGDGNDKGMSQMDTPKFLGFRVSYILEINLHDPSRAPDLIDTLMAAGANTIYGVSYSFSDPNGLSKQAYDKAVQDAQDRASRLAELSNLKLGRLVSISDASVGTPPITYQNSGMGAGAGGGGALFPGQQPVQIDVIATYEASPK